MKFCYLFIYIYIYQFVLTAFSTHASFLKFYRLYKTKGIVLTSLHTSMVPNTTCRPSKKLSPMRMTVAPPVVQPSLGLMAFMHGVAAYDRTENIPLRTVLYQTHTHTHPYIHSYTHTNTQNTERTLTPSLRGN